MTVADPRDGLLMIADDLERAWYGSGPLNLDGFADRIRAIAHARPEAVDSKALEVLFDALSDEHGGEHHEEVCDVCRAIATLTPERAP